MIPVHNCQLQSLVLHCQLRLLIVCKNCPLFQMLDNVVAVKLLSVPESQNSWGRGFRNAVSPCRPFPGIRANDDLRVFAEINDWAIPKNWIPRDCKFWEKAPEAALTVPRSPLAAMSSASLARAWKEANIWKRAYCRSLEENAQLNEEIAFLRRELAAAHTRAAPQQPPSKKRKHDAPPKQGKKNDCSCDGYCADCGEPCKECPEKHRD
jgi:hypothetical protein